jgi:hypothetical protein
LIKRQIVIIHGSYKRHHFGIVVHHVINQKVFIEIQLFYIDLIAHQKTKIKIIKKIMEVELKDILNVGNYLQKYQEFSFFMML